MRCLGCDVILNDNELSRKDKETDLFIDLCKNCLTHSNEATYNIDLDIDLITTEGDSPWLSQQ